jgi:hypothetical protein
MLTYLKQRIADVLNPSNSVKTLLPGPLSRFTLSRGHAEKFRANPRVIAKAA